MITIVVTAILFSSMSIPAYETSGGFVKRTVTTDLVKEAFVDDNAAENVIPDDEIDLKAPEKPDIDKYSVVDSPSTPKSLLWLKKLIRVQMYR